MVSWLAQAKPSFTYQVPNFFVCKTKFYLTSPSYGLTNMSIDSKIEIFVSCINLDIDLVLPTRIKSGLDYHFIFINIFLV